MKNQTGNKHYMTFVACCVLKAKDCYKTLWSILWISRSILLEYVIKFNTVSLYWHNLKFSIIIIFLKINFTPLTLLEILNEKQIIKVTSLNLYLYILKQSTFRKCRLHYIV